MDGRMMRMYLRKQYREKKEVLREEEKREALQIEEERVREREC